MAVVPLSRRGLRIWVLGLIPVLVIVAVLTVVLVRRTAGAGTVSQSQRGTVLLVSGYGGGAGGMQTIADALTDTDRELDTVVPATGDNTGDIEVQARHLNQVAQQQIAAGAPSVDVVAHSAGGVVARVWANEYGADVARRVVTLGSPHHGTDVATAAAALAGGTCPVACQQLVPGSSLLDGLPETPASARWISIYTANDETVVPISTSRLNGALNIEVQGVCAGARVTHGALVRDPLTIGLIELALDGPPLATAPGPGQCAALRAQG